MPYDVFISHSKGDKSTADAMCAALEANGIHCWIAPRDIVPGKEWGEAIIDGLSQCPVMILVYSSLSNQSQQVRREVERAVNKGSVIIPFRIEDVPMTKSLEYFLSSPHWLDALTPPMERHLESLTRTVQFLLQERAEGQKQKESVHSSPVAAAKRPPLPKLAAAAYPSPLLMGMGGAGLLLGLVVAVLLMVNWLTRPTTVPIAAPGKSPEVSLAAPPPDKTPAPASDNNAKTTPTSAPKSPEKIMAAVKTQSPSAKSNVPPSTAGTLGSPAVPMALQQELSSVDLRGGKVVLQIAGESIHSGQQSVDVPVENPIARSKRVLLLTNRRESSPPATEGSDATDTVELKFQINNLSQEQVTLSKLQLHLLGMVQRFEDRIAVPISPHVVKPLKNMEVAAGSGPISIPDVPKIFADEDTPLEQLKFKATSSMPELVQAALVERDLILRFTPGKTGRCYVTVEAIDPFELSSATTFEVAVKGDEPLAEIPVEERRIVATPGAASNPELYSPGDVPLPANVVREKTLDLGLVKLDYDLSSQQLVAVAASGDLLPSQSPEVRKPLTIRPFTLRLAPRLVVRPPGQSKEDALVGFKDPRRKLAVKTPVLGSVWQVFMISANIVSANGTRQEVYADRLFVLHLLPQQGQLWPLRLAYASDESFDQFLIKMTYETMTTHQYTMAYNMACRCQSVPEEFDKTAYSLYCYFSDGGSPFRSPTGAPRFADSDRWPRSNLAESITALRAQKPILHRALESAVTLLANDKQAEEDFRKRMEVFKKALQASTGNRQPVPSYVRVLTAE